MSSNPSIGHPVGPSKRSTRRLVGGGVALLLLAIMALGAFYMRISRVPDLQIPTPMLPANNAYDDFTQAGQMAHAMVNRTPSNMPSTPETRAQIESFANYKAAAVEFAPALDLLHEAFTKPCLFPSVRTSQSNSFSNMAEIRNIARNIYGAGRYEEMAGHPLRAVQTWLDGVEMAEMVEHGGGWINCLVGTACERICLNRFEELLPLLKPEELASVAMRLETLQRKQVAYSDVLLEEGYIHVAGIQHAMRNSKPGQTRLAAMVEVARNYIQTDSTQPLTEQEQNEVGNFRMADKQQVLQEVLDYYHALSEEAKRPYTGPSSVPVPHNLFLTKSGKLVQDVHIHVLRDATVLTLIQVEVALYRYRVAHHAFPEQLSALSPALLTSVPVDPFGGKPLHYRRTDNGSSYLLYSIGPDLKDDGGAPPILSTGTMQEAGDIVSGYLYPTVKTSPAEMQRLLENVKATMNRTQHILSEQAKTRGSGQ